MTVMDVASDAGRGGGFPAECSTTTGSSVATVDGDVVQNS